MAVSAVHLPHFRFPSASDSSSLGEDHTRTGVEPKPESCAVLYRQGLSQVSLAYSPTFISPLSPRPPRPNSGISPAAPSPTTSLVLAYSVLTWREKMCTRTPTREVWERTGQGPKFNVNLRARECARTLRFYGKVRQAWLVHAVSSLDVDQYDADAYASLNAS